MDGEGGGAAGVDVVAERKEVWPRVVAVVVAVHVAVVGLVVAGHFGAQVSAAGGVFGTPGVLTVEKCGETPKSTSSDTHGGSSGGEHYCFGTFHPDGGGPAVESVRLRGGSGDAYAPPPRGSSCWRSVDRPWWCGGDPALQSHDVRARMVDGQAWIWGSGVALPAFGAVAGLSVLGGGLLWAAKTWLWPGAERWPRWHRRAAYAVTVAGFVAFLGALLALATVNV